MGEHMKPIVRSGIWIIAFGLTVELAMAQPRPRGPGDGRFRGGRGAGK
jgi:hypothetical protein